VTKGKMRIVEYRILAAAFLSATIAVQAQAQFSSDFPGVPRASISITSSHQNRTSWALSGFRIPTSGTTGDTIGGGVRVGWGQSYRIATQFEAGFDLTLLDGSAVVPPSGKGTDTANKAYVRGLAGYGIRVGAKFRPISSLDPDGYGYEVSIGGGFQPKLKALYGVERRGDSLRMGGQFSGDQKPNAAFQQNPFASLSASTIVAAMASYRARRVRGDAALVSESVSSPATATDPSPIREVDGISLRAGGSFRILPSLAVGGSFWGSGSPPWWDEIQLGLPGKRKNEQFGFLLQFGSDPESGIDLMLTSPTGKFSESARLFIRARSTR